MSCKSSSQTDRRNGYSKKKIEWKSGSDEMLEWNVLDEIEWIGRILWLMFGLYAGLPGKI